MTPKKKSHQAEAPELHQHHLPRIAIMANKNIDWFFNELDHKTDLVVEQLLERFEIQAKKKVHNYPFLMGEGIWIDSDKLGCNDEVREVLKNGTLSVGFIGLAEALKALIGVHHGESEVAQNLGLDIISHMLQPSGCTVSENKTELYPAGNTCGRSVRQICGNRPETFRFHRRRNRSGILYKQFPHSCILPYQRL